MALEVRTACLNFSYNGSQSISFDFGNKVNSFGSAIKGFEMGYTTGSNIDNNIIDIGVDIVDCFLNGESTIVANVAFSLYDGSGNQGYGIIEVTVFADVGSK